MKDGGIYLVNIMDDYDYGRYIASLIHTLRHTFNYVYLFATNQSWETVTKDDFVILATDRYVDLADYEKFVTEDGEREAYCNLHDAVKLEKYLAEREPILLTDDYAPTDILLAPLFR